MNVPPNFSIVTLGVADVAASAVFYRGLGWEQRGDQSVGITWFRTAGTWIGLFGYEDLAEDVGLAAGPVPLAGSAPAYRGVTLALNFASEAEVDEAMSEAIAAGAVQVKEPTRAEWGGYSGYWADPDGHLWEVAYAPGMPARDDGTIDVPH
ncbi:VOC family protein [Brevibacterium jeotgali]|uniref:VOC domain-containing protein n=1 Tax=Brevibacterium jeotgali TaxID=1262550 RepID=A0A2H1L3H8_9MICO|nr:VOC family protein [Brevibacterium jeotgali]TWC01703.1 hypothetical protein FB108_0357 [Brevibacterium jeotgali]SMY11448.1 hypothetical protein BJEO58_01033 [Brevibacterium jeotgali]